ncbi:uncharacterized protein [Nicotiana tomentosiformis]|uniref:uncharacterized protein n=1 Tax=Nicotiana tomentosiformis TaxID=4098 RepID=UPI00388C34C0
MLMYNTICKVNKNFEKTIVGMTVAGFTGQLKGWWDNYLMNEYRAEIMNAVKVEEGQNYHNCVYSLALNIIEHFSGRWSDNSETLRIMLQNLRCKSLTYFRWYKDVFLSRVMELPECNSTHWKSKFIDGLPTLFAERVRKALRGTTMSIDYNSYSYGNHISIYILRNKKESHRHKKEPYRYKKKKKGSFDKRFEQKEKRRKARKEFIKSNEPDAFYKCGRVGHYARDCKVKDKIKNLDIDDSIKDSLYKILLNSSPDNTDQESNYGDSSTDEDLRVLQEEEYIFQKMNVDPANRIRISVDLEVNVLTNDSLLELLRVIKNPELRSQIIDQLDKIQDTIPTSPEIEEIPSQNR